MLRGVVYGALFLACSCFWSRGAWGQRFGAAEANAERDRLEAKIEAALEETTSLQFLEQPLGDITQFLEDRHKIEVQLDAQALDTAGVNTDSPVTIDVEGITLRSALDLMLRTLELTWCIRDGVLLVTTPEEVENELVTEVYDVQRFLYVMDKNGQRKRFTEPLLDAVMSHVAPTTWTDVGGVGAIDVLGESAVVSQTWDIQREVDQTFAAMEMALAQYQQGRFDAPIDVGVPTTGMTPRIREALQKSASLHFQEQPLGDVVGELEDRYKIEIQLDTQALDTAGVTTDTPVTIDVEKVSLRSALALFLDALELTYTIRDEVLLITTDEEVEMMLVTRFYPIKDLVAAESLATAGVRNANGGPRKYGAAVDRILDVVTFTIEPTTWVEVGGTGSIGYMPQFRGMVVSQTLDVHSQIDALLAMLRNPGGKPAAPTVRVAEPTLAQQPKPTTAQRPTTAAADRGNDVQSVRVYGVFADTGARRSMEEVNGLAARIQAIVAPEAWRIAGGTSYVHVVDQAIVVNATPEEHRRVVALLNARGIAASPEEELAPSGGNSNNNAGR